MVRKNWNRKSRRNSRLGDRPLSNSSNAVEYKIERICPKKRKPKHPGYTLIPFEKLGIFENEPLLTNQKK